MLKPRDEYQGIDFVRHRIFFEIKEGNETFLISYTLGPVPEGRSHASIKIPQDSNDLSSSNNDFALRLSFQLINECLGQLLKPINGMLVRL